MDAPYHRYFLPFFQDTIDTIELIQRTHKDGEFALVFYNNSLNIKYLMKLS